MEKRKRSEDGSELEGYGRKQFLKAFGEVEMEGWASFIHHIFS